MTALIVVAFGIGVWLGGMLQGYAWASNAKAIQRKEWMGKLFKVVPAEKWDEIEDREAGYAAQREMASSQPQVQQ